MRAVLIDAKNKQVLPVKISGDLSSIYLAMDVETIQIGFCDHKTGETMYVDEEGRINGTTYGFIFGGAKFVGNGLILGTDVYGENQNSKVDADALAQEVQFIDIDPEEEQKNLSFTILSV